SGEGLEHIPGGVEALCHRFDGCVIPAGTPGVPIPKASFCDIHPGTTESHDLAACLSWSRQLSDQAAALFSSRSLRRRIFPTLVFGSSVLNSICLGPL